MTSVPTNGRRNPLWSVLAALVVLAVGLIALVLALVPPGRRPPAPDGPSRPYLLECRRCAARAILMAPGELEATGVPCMSCGGATGPVGRTFHSL